MDETKTETKMETYTATRTGKNGDGIQVVANGVTYMVRKSGGAKYTHVSVWMFSQEEAAKHAEGWIKFASTPGNLAANVNADEWVAKYLTALRAPKFIAHKSAANASKSSFGDRHFVAVLAVA